MPDLRLPTLNGEPFDSSTLEGRPTVVNFWATWCVPCLEEHRLLQSAARYYGKDVDFIGVVYQDERSRAQDYLARSGNQFTQLWDEGSVAAINFGVAGVPESFIVDATGTVRYKREGVLTRSILEEHLEPLIRTNRR